MEIGMICKSVLSPLLYFLDSLSISNPNVTVSLVEMVSKTTESAGAKAATALTTSVSGRERLMT